MKPILIISGTEDAHAENMRKILAEEKVPHFLFPTEKYPFAAQITYEDSSTPTMSYAGETIKMTPEWSIWNRRLFPPEFPEGFPKNLEEMVQEEAKRTIQGIMATHRGLIVNNPLYNSAANNKLEQLQRAREIGLQVPATIVTNEPEKAIQFYKAQKEDIIFKMQKLPIIQEGEEYQTIMTSRVLPEHLRDIERVRNNPCCFQERIEKEHEIRVTVIGERLFPIAIHSQDAEVSKDDFRRYDFEKVKYDRVDLSEEVEKKIITLVRKYQLHYAAIDIIYTPKGEYVFLEINPNGQYLWTEEMSKVPITRSLIDYLSSGGRKEK